MQKIGRDARIWMVMAWIALFLCFPFHRVFAAGKISVEGTVSANPVSEGEDFVFTVTVTSENSINVSEPRLSDLSGFDLNNSWVGSESRSTFTNGTFQVEQSRTFNYTLVAKKSGKLTIPAAQVVVNGQSLSTKPIVMDVKPSTQGPGNLAGRGRARPRAINPTDPQPGDEEDPQQEMEDLFNQLVQRHRLPQFRGGGGGGTLPQGGGNPENAFFIEAEVDKNKAYVGEQITANWYLYTRGIIRDIDTLKYPSLSGFWKEEIELATRLNFENFVVNGVVYKRALLASYALFPIKEGTATVDPYKAKCTVMSGDMFGFGRPYQFTKASQPIPVIVEALPTQGKPESFSGAVGDFDVTSTLDQNTVPVNQPVTLKIHFEGRGNAKLIDLPPLNLPQGIELYDTKKEAKFFRDGRSYKNFEVLLIPREAGTVTLPPVAVSIFNPKTGKYVTSQTQAHQLVVQPGEGSPVAGSIPLPKQEAKPEVPQVSPPFISRVQKANFWDPPLWIWALFYLATFVLLALKGLSVFGFVDRRENLKKRVAKRSKRLLELASKGDYRAVGVQSTNLIYLVLGELAGRGGANREFDVLLSEGPPSLRRERGADLRRVLTTAESLAFAPEHMVTELQNKQRLKTFVTDLEKILNASVQLSENE